MFKKETSEQTASPELNELTTPVAAPEDGAPEAVGNSMMLIGAIPLALMLVGVLIGNRIIGIVLFILAVAGFFIMWKKATGALNSSLNALRDEAFAVANEDLPRLGAALSSGEPIANLQNNRPRVTFEDAEFASVASGLSAVRDSAAGIGESVTALQSGISDTFVNLARRNQALVDRQLEAIDTLEAEERDSDRLSLLYRVDHLATRMHRNAESLLVLADAKTPERHSAPVPLQDVLRVAIGEVEDYRRIVPISFDDALVAGHKAQDMAHLLAELMENAAQHSPPGTAVDVTGAQSATGDYMITILDHGTGVAAGQLQTLNHLLERPPASTLTISHSIGLQVVSRISHSLGIKVRLDHGEDNGVVATVFVPAAVVNSWSQTVGGAAAAPTAPAPAPVAPAPVTDLAPAAPIAPIPDLAAPAPVTDLAPPAPIAPIPDLAAPAPVTDLAPPAPNAPIPDLAAPAPVADLAPPAIPDLAAPAAPSTFPTIGDEAPLDGSMPLESLLDPSSDIGDEMFQMPLPQPVAESAEPANVFDAPAPVAEAPAPEVFEPGASTFEAPAPAAPEVFEPAPAPVAEAPAPEVFEPAPASVAEAPAPEVFEPAPAPVAEAPAPEVIEPAPAPTAEAPQQLDSPPAFAEPAPAPAAPAAAAASVAARSAVAVATAPVASGVATQPGKTTGGLTKRTRSAPSDTPKVDFDEARTAPSQRSPDQVKSMLSRYKSGLERGRGPAETDGEK